LCRKNVRARRFVRQNSTKQQWIMWSWRLTQRCEGAGWCCSEILIRNRRGQAAISELFPVNPFD
jgi:hypothetical protein